MDDLQYQRKTKREWGREKGEREGEEKVAAERKCGKGGKSRNVTATTIVLQYGSSSLKAVVVRFLRASGGGGPPAHGLVAAARCGSTHPVLERLSWGKRERERAGEREREREGRENKIK